MSDPSDLVTWLRAQLDEDERLAKRAASLCGCHPPAPKWLFGDESTDGRIVVADEPHPEVRRKLGRRWNGSYENMFAAEHIARWDPARALAEVEAKRQLLDLAEFIGCADGFDVENMICELLAAPYTDRPGYREEWRP
jgi:hypothetical protein